MIQKFFCNKIFSFFDSIMISTFCILLVQKHMVSAAVVLILGPFVAVMMDHQYNIKIDDREWQQHAEAGSRLMAIRKHRTLYNSTLKQAYDAVTEYEQKRGLL